MTASFVQFRNSVLKKYYLPHCHTSQNCKPSYGKLNYNASCVNGKTTLNYRYR